MDKQDYGQMSQYVEQDEKEISLQDILYIIKRRIFWIIGTFALVVAVVLLYLNFATPIFRASVTMRVEPTQQSSGLENLFAIQSPGGSQRIATEVELITSRVNLEEVVSRLGLYDKMLEEYDGDSPPSRSVYALSLANRITVSSVRDTNIVRISVEHPDRALAVDLANTLAEVYNDMLKNIAQKEFMSRREFIEGQIPILEGELAVAETALRRYKEQEGLILLDEEARILLQTISSFDRQIAPYRIQMDNSNATAAMFQNMIQQQGGNYQTLDQVRRQDEVKDLLNQIISLRLELAGISSQSAAASADIRVAITSRENRLGNMLSQMMLRYSHSYEHVPREYYIELASVYAKVLLAETNITYLSELRGGHQEKIRTLPQIEQRMLELTREVKSRESLYILLLGKLEEAKITEAGITGSASIVDNAILPRTPVAPNKRLILAVGALLGMFLGVLIAFLVETFDITLREEESIKRTIGGDPIVLGRIPRLVFSGNNTDELLVYRDPTSPGAEAFKLISTNILFSRVKSPQIVVVSSSEMGEGKTTVTANIAVAMAQNGLKTLIVDADMRRPRIERIFGINKLEGGVVNYLLQNKEISTLIKKPFSDLQNLHVLPVGPLPPNPTAVLTSEKFRLMLEGLRKVYDRVVLDLPPLLVASDAMICSRISDGIVLVVRAGTASKRGVSLAGETIRSSQISLLGLVINEVTADSRYGYYHYYYYYSGSSDKAKGGRRAAVRSAKKALRAERKHAVKLSSLHRSEENGNDSEKANNA